MITVRCKGGLGNQLFQYAAGRALAIRHAVPLRLMPGWYDVEMNQAKVRRSFDLSHFRIAATVVSEAEARAARAPAGSRVSRAWARLQQKLSGIERWENHDFGYDQTFERIG